MNLTLPEMGEGVIEATISRWLKQPGDAVTRNEPVVEVETDKVTTEVVADDAGTLTAILIEEGATVAVGTVLAEITTAEAVPQPVPAGGPEPGQTAHVNGNGHLPAGRNGPNGRVSPVVARMAAEHELDLGLITGTGLKGRITKRDVTQFLNDQKPNWGSTSLPRHPATPPPRSNNQQSTDDPALDSKIVPLSPMRRSIAEHMVASVQTSPHATTIHEVDFSAVMTHRNAHKQTFAEKGVNLTFTAYIMLAVAEALGKFPLANSSWHHVEGSPTGIELHQAINIGMATAVQDGAGLVVPVIKHAADYNLLGMARVVGDLANRARDNKLTTADMQGGTFTVTNHGVSGSLFATPIINQPQAGILGVGAIKKQVVVIEDEFGNDVTAIRPMAYLSCSFDHRILDGVSADGFVSAVRSHLENKPLKNDY